MDPPFPAYSPQNKESFAYETVVKRWPVILTQLIDRVYQDIHVLVMEKGAGNDDPRVVEGRTIIERIAVLKSDMARDKSLQPIPDDGGVDIPRYNEQLAELQAQNYGTWFTAPWLFAECYLYRIIRSWFTLTTHWQQYDPFQQQKDRTFRSSGKAVYQLALTMANLTSKDSASEEQLHVLWDEMIQMCLWGNATDLSLLPTMDYSQIQSLQSVGKEAQAASFEYILRNDTEQVWDHVKTLKDAQLDIVLDNSGFELFTDMVFADFLVTHTPYFSKAVFHAKHIPWFVSDVTPLDYVSILSGDMTATKDAAASYFESSTPTDDELAALEKMVSRWQEYQSKGIFALSVDANSGLGVPTKESGKGLDGAVFWTLSDSYWKLPEQTELLSQLEKSGLVVFKGDLNYRKLTADVAWPTTTPFSEAIGPLSGHIHVLSLRTCKADVVVGLTEGIEERLDGDVKEKGWRVNGKYGLISYDPKKATL